ncbi:hypothetical protein BGY98DRAFT_976811 [Russula aff. rugulosa BPL654]|nr:hypothetical protein BGY98DRAFT_976811 [Russula aff. rugulosa BPL654]
MVGSTSSSRPFSLSVVMDATGPARILKGATAAALVPLSRRSSWASRAVRNRARAHPGLLPVQPFNNTTTTTRPTTARVVVVVQHPPVPTPLPSPLPPCPRRVKSMKRRTNVLGPELAPASLSQLSRLSTQIDSPHVTFNGKRISPPRLTSEMANYSPPLSAVSVSSPTCTELPSITPLSPIRTSTFILSPPPAAKRSTTRFSNHNPHSNPRSPLHSSRPAPPWPLITALSSSDLPHHVYEERNTSSDTSGSTDTS